MLVETRERPFLRLFADMLDYPSADLRASVRECETLLLAHCPDAAVSLSRFQAFVEETPQGRTEEIYTMAFDLDAACHPYVGYHLFGESYKRSVFLLELKERYRKQGFVAPDSDLADRLSVILRFLSGSADGDLNREIIQEALLPALEKMSKQSQEAASEPENGLKPYHNVLLALTVLLKQQMGSKDTSVPEAFYPGGESDVR